MHFSVHEGLTHAFLFKFNRFISSMLMLTKVVRVFLLFIYFLFIYFFYFLLLFLFCFLVTGIDLSYPVISLLTVPRCLY